MPSTEARPAPGARRREKPPGGPARFDSWPAAIWVFTIALDFFWLSNPVVFMPFDESLDRAGIATLIAVVATLPRLQLPRPPWTVLAVLAYGFATALWSTNPGATVRYSAMFALIALLAMVIAANTDARTFAQGMTLGGVMVLAASWYALHEQLPRADVPAGATGWLAGVGGNRNVLAYTLVISLAFAISYLPRRWSARLLWGLAIGSLLVGVYLAESGTGYAASLIVVATGILLGVLDKRRRPRARGAGRRWSVGVLAVLVVVGGAVGIELVARALGRNTSTLSGRVPLWESIWDSTTGTDRVFGSGWGAIWPHAWDPMPPSAAYTEILNRAHNIFFHGHNSMFDLLPEVGLVGVALYATTYVQVAVRALRLREPGAGPTAARLEAARVTLLGLLVVLLYGLTEPMSTIPLGWFVVVVLATGARPTPSERPALP